MNKNSQYIIIHENEKEYWNNKLGWVEHQIMATYFNIEQRYTLSLPINGKWYELKF
jgi:hypothetical protein